MMGFPASHVSAGLIVMSAQLRSADNVAPLRLAMNLFGIAFLWRVFGSQLSAMILAPWSAAFVILTSVNFLSAARRKGRARHQAAARDLHRHGVLALCEGLLWAGCIQLLSLHGDPSQVVAIWTLFSCVMVCGAISYIATPLSTTCFLLPCMLALPALFDETGQFPLLLLATGYALLLLVGCFFYARIFAREHSASVQLEEKSEVVSLLLREYEDGGSDWLWQTDATRRLNGVSVRLAESLGREPAHLEGMLLVQALAGEAWETGDFHAGLHSLADQLKRRESFSNLAVSVEVKGEMRWWELSASPRHGDDGRFLGFRGVGSDITSQRESADRIAQLASFDSLTGLPNRTHLRDVLDRAMAETRQRSPGCAFLMIDLDRFKAVNDTLGHQIGDKLLSQVARRLRHICTGPEFCGRIGGDEFAVVIPRLFDEHAVSRLAGAIIGGLSVPYQVDAHMLYIGASVGSAVSSTDGGDSEALIRSADLALYRAKGEGGGIHCAYEPQLHAQAEERRRLELALREALDGNQLHVVYQPVVDAASSEILGFEALLRWTHPELGPVSPAKFVPVAEDARLIGPIGEWVLRTACAEAVRWPAHVRVAVNVSAEQLAHPSFVAAVVSALAQSGLEAQRLELEVTESVFVNADTGAIKILDQLLTLGIHLSLDDFGTGYSSLGYLSRTRFNTIKIDRSFVVGASQKKAESLAIIRAVVTLADSLGMATTAEGVETEAELAMVRELGCRKIQGYYFGRPMPAAEAAALFPADQLRARA
ncbi:MULTISPECIES: putative bifunctional diguanylate cyclase/phosphodiesterase [Sphingobium]|uniref:putative bifunctional diguanylate cyclase/phosphodiesterase n=1 Tax=Sphingobium sp. MI1205 TaxID=407020 RepID=UPI000780DA77|nr:EAL domain-containing protein [Sphingobium sp. MI1205]